MVLQVTCSRGSKKEADGMSCGKAGLMGALTAQVKSRVLLA